jgi:hypothetical protein
MERKTGAIRKTGSTRKTAAIRRTDKGLPPGSAPLVFATAMVGVWSEIIGFFSLYYGFRHNRPLLLFLFSVLAPLVGVLVWNRLCKRNRWPYFTGGAEGEPYGLYAFVWGLVTTFPIIFCVQLLTSNHPLNSILAVMKWVVSREFALILSYSLFAGLAALLFYGFRPGRSLRARLGGGAGRHGTGAMRFETFDLVMVGIWALVLSSIPTLSVSLFAAEVSPGAALLANALGYAAPVSIAMAACLLIVSGYFYFADYRRLDPKGMFKGFLAEFALRCSLFWGTWLLMDGRHMAALRGVVEGALRKEFGAPPGF